MLNKRSFSVFPIFNYIILTFLGLICILPVFHLLAVSLSQNNFAEANLVGVIPKGFTFDSYVTIFQGGQFVQSFFISVKRAIVGTIINLIMTILLAYPVSKPSKKFRGRNIYMAFIIFSMLFSGGLIPMYFLVKNIGIFDTVWALVLPTAVPTFSVILMMNFLRQLPKEIEESASVDGSSYFRSLISIVLPMSLPVIATIALFSFVMHWNAWFDGMIFNSKIENYPLQTYLQVLLTNRTPMSIDESIINRAVGTRTLKSAQIFVTMLPLLLIYPFLQRYFVTGIVVGSVKG